MSCVYCGDQGCRSCADRQRRELYEETLVDRAQRLPVADLWPHVEGLQGDGAPIIDDALRACLTWDALGAVPGPYREPTWALLRARAQETAASVLRALRAELEARWVKEHLKLWDEGGTDAEG